jgi:hypothetical protein
MRTVFLLLLFANIAFLAYGTMWRDRAAPAHPVSSLQVSPERIRLIRSGEPGGAKPATVPTPTLAAACIEWGVVAGPDVARADTAIAALDLPSSNVQRTVTDAGGYWVYLPPAKSKAQLDRNLSELSAAGVADYFVIQDAAAWRNAISLGIFKSEDAAKAYLASVESKGVKSATVGRREQFLKQIAYFVREPSKPVVARLAELQQEFPGTKMKAVPCPE